MIKKISKIAGMALVALMAACTNEVDDLFDTPAQQRINEEIKACQALLTDAEYGWALEYYPHQTQRYGGYAMTVKFENGKVTAASEITGDPNATVTSLYSLKTDMGPTLNFDTYNEILHFFADPDNSGGSGLGKGYEGDYEFVIQSHAQDEILLKGKKTKNLMRMTRLTEPGESFLAALMAKEEKIEAAVGRLGYTGQLNGQEISMTSPADRRMTIQAGDELHSTAFIYTADGIRFYAPLEIGDKVIESLIWSDAEDTYLLDGKAMNIVYDPVYSKYTRYLGEYTMNYTYGNSARIKEVELKPYRYNATEKTYVLDGFLFPLLIQYNVERDCMEILTYNTGEFYVAVWEIIGSGNLSWGAGLGLVSQLKEGTDNVYEFVDNGKWGNLIARAIILWNSSSGEYKALGDSRFQYISFTKK